MGSPSGTVTLLFTDIAGSTSLWEKEPVAMAVALARHDQLLRSAIEGAGGVVFKTAGDSFCAAFSRPHNGLDAAKTARLALAAESWPESVPIRVRMGLHTGSCVERDGDYFGPTVNRAARLEAIAHGGQTVLSRATVELVQDALPVGLVLRDLGEHRLKDLGRPERVYQMNVEGLDDDFPPLRSLDNPELGNNLPVQLSSFVGRERELAELRALVGESRLVTLVGVGGSGKTRLALQVAVELLDGSGNGVWFVDLAPLSDGDLVAAQTAAAIGVRDEPERPSSETLIDALRDQRLLLVMDNCEQVIDGCAKLVERLLRSCPRVHVLATSRESLALDGERLYRVPSLSLPQTAHDGWSLSDSVFLFMERASEHQPGFTITEDNFDAVASICRQLDGIPLAIELAAARLNMMSLDDVEARLDQRFRLLSGSSRSALPRHQTLRALVDWSFDLLHQREKSALCRLSVFAGGFDLSAAEAVCASAEVAEWEVADVLGSLVDKSLVQTDSTPVRIRYRFLETIRQYAMERFEQTDQIEQSQTRSAHATWFLNLAESAAPHIEAAEQSEWLARLEVEYDNFRAALAYFLLGTDMDDALRMENALGPFWEIRGYGQEGIDAFEQILERTAGQDPSVPRAAALCTVGRLYSERGDYSLARPRLEQSLDMARLLGDAAITAKALCGLAWLENRRSKYDAALGLLEEALPLAKRVKNVRLIGHILNNRAAVLHNTRHSDAREFYLQALSCYREVKDRSKEAMVLNNLGALESEAGNTEAARLHLESALEISLANTGFRDPDTLYNVGEIALIGGDYRNAFEYFTDSVKIACQIGWQSVVAYDILGLAMHATAIDFAERAATLHGASDALFDQRGEVPNSSNLEMRERDRAHLRDLMGADRFDVAYANGRELSTSESITLALQVPQAGSAEPL